MTYCCELFDRQVASDLQQKLDRYITENEIPGVILYVVTPDGEWEGASGVANLATRTPMTTRHLVRIATVTQLFVAVIALQLIENEELSLEDTIADWLPDEICDRLPNCDEIAIRNLLQHTSGLADYEDNEVFEGAIEISTSNYVWTAKEAITYAYDLEAAFEPEEYREYSNTNYVLLELIIEAVTGNSLAQEFTSRISKVLDLKATFFEGKETLKGELANGYSNLNNDNVPAETSNSNNAYGLADCGLISNIYDVAALLEGLFINEELLGIESLEAMTDWYETSDGSCYGLGIDRWESDWGELWSQDGSVGGFYSTVWYLPEEGISMICFENHSDNSDPDEMLKSVLSLLLGKFEED
ncbi:MAG: serine hydrolase domain-containing protein [Cyanobacteriota bacterium]|nr:serine hydrolase domain-containing protein [Cyanobacteriota bacterium]